MTTAAIPADATPNHRDQLATLSAIDTSCALPLKVMFVAATAWLLVGSALALVASLKMHIPAMMDSAAWLTFGRMRPAHLNTMIFGWASQAGIATLLWLEARLCKTRLPQGNLLIAGTIVWNIAVLAGTIEILRGNGTSVEWLEFPYFWSFIFAAVFALIMFVSFQMFAARQPGHIYVSQWYLFGALLWFPFLYLVANTLIHANVATGVAQGTANWWFAHNVLGLWLTPVGVAAAYYLIPKVLGRPIHSYYLSIFGFWTLAIFYNWAGTHHLIGGPVPAWAVTVGVVGSMMMFIPVTTVAINHHMTMKGHFRMLKTSPTLRFVVFGAMCYTAVSFQGSLQSLRTINEVTHFTHYTIAHAHLGVYAFFTMIMFGAMYYIGPRITEREWASPGLIRLHFWTVAIGMAVYWIGLSYGGVLQGLAMNDPEVAFLDLMSDTAPYLLSRSVAGILMTVGHIAFAILVFKIFLSRSGRRTPAASQRGAA